MQFAAKILPTLIGLLRGHKQPSAVNHVFRKRVRKVIKSEEK
jgi:hypothetical protein